MFDLLVRPRRMRQSSAFRELVRETVLSPKDFIYPMFAVPGTGIREEISTLPGIYHMSPDEVVKEAKKAWDLGIPGIMLFGLPSYKDEIASSAWDDKEPVQEATRRIKEALPELLVSTDVCLCQYSSIGQCGIVDSCGCVDNDGTVENLVKVALSHAKAGADMVAPSDMMDGRVGAMRSALDEAGYKNTAILAYSAKYNSAYYGPFRAAADSAPQHGDRSTYQMDPANSREALLEVELDIQEGADMVMVKPALAYLDIIKSVKDISPVPVAAYNVSGEYAMLKFSARAGLVDEKRIILETLTGIKRAGADIIISYHALEAAAWLNE